MLPDLVPRPRTPPSQPILATAHGSLVGGPGGCGEPIQCRTDPQELPRELDKERQSMRCLTKHGKLKVVTGSGLGASLEAPDLGWPREAMEDETSVPVVSSGPGCRLLRGYVSVEAQPVDRV